MKLVHITRVRSLPGLPKSIQAQLATAQNSIHASSLPYADYHRFRLTFPMLRYAITDGSLALGQTQQSVGRAEPTSTPDELHARLLAHATLVARRHIDFFLLREPTLPASRLADLTRELLRIFAAAPTRLLIHNRPDIALAARAHGVHLPSIPGQLTPTHIRTLYAAANLPTPTISLSCHTEEDLDHARTLQPDLILFGPIFGKQVHGQSIHPSIGLEPLRQACLLAAAIPVLALGGITEANNAACLEAGAAGVAAIRLFLPPRIK